MMLSLSFVAVFIISVTLTAWTYARGITMFKETPFLLKMVLSLACDAATVFIWELSVSHILRASIGKDDAYIRFIFISGIIFIFFFYMSFDFFVFNWRKWFPKPVGFDMQNFNRFTGSKSARKSNLVYADSIPIKVKGDGWVRR